MAKQIGDYVHYNQENYKGQGINRVTEAPSGNQASAVSNLKAQLEIGNEVKSLLKTANDLEKMFNNLYYPKEDADAQSKKFREAMHQAAQELLEEKFGLMAGNFDPNNVGVNANKHYAQLKKAVKATREKIKVAAIKKEDTVKDLQKKLQKMNELLDLDEIKNLEFAKQEIERAKSYIKQMESTISNQTNVQLSDETVEELNRIVQEFSKDPLPSNQAGDVFEQVTPYIALRSSNLAKDELVKRMKNLSKEANLGEATFDVEMPDLESSNDLEVDLKQGNIAMKTVTVRSKTDMLISYIDEEGREFTNIAGSAKSLSGKHIKIVEDTPLFRVFTLSQNYEQATHYLNIVTISGGKGKPEPSQILEANRLTKALAVKMGAEGYDTKNPAEILIVNDRKEKHIYVYNLKALVYLIEQAMVKEGKYTNIIKDKKKIFTDNFTIDQTMEDSKENRIGKLVQVLQDIKITGNLSGTQLNAYLALLQQHKLTG